MRTPFSLALCVLAFALALPAVASAQTSTPTPKPSPTATPQDVSAELPEMTDADPVPGEGWDGSSAASGILLGLRGGFHAFQPADIQYGGLALEVTAAMPVYGPFWGALVGGYHTGNTRAGYDEPDPKYRFFDVQFGAVEGQYRHNVGRVNVIGALGAGYLSANSAEVTLEDGTPTTASGSGVVGHVMAGALVPVGRFGIVGQLRYSFAPVAFKETDETLGMGGLTIAAGVDFAF